MCRQRMIKRLVGLCSAAFGLRDSAIVFSVEALSHFLEAVALVLAGILLLGASK